jgi:hypothetical protein
VVHALELHGRLCRKDGRPANPGAYDLLFRLHRDAETDDALWEDTLHGVGVVAGGYFHAILGERTALGPHLFDGTPRYLSTRIVRNGRSSEEAADRVPLLGGLIRVGDGLVELAQRVATLESAAPAGPAETATVRHRLIVLRRRLRRIEGGGGVLAPLVARLLAIEARLDRIDGSEGRIAHLEDELEDLVGPDGDVVDLGDRLDRLEGRSPGVEGGAVFGAHGPIEPGDVVCVAAGGRVARAGRPYDPCVVGVALGHAGVERVRVASHGTARCRVEAESAPIEVGHLLTTSDVPGHACVAGDRDRAQGAIVGKALAPLRKGRGEIEVLVMIR